MVPTWNFQVLVLPNKKLGKGACNSFRNKYSLVRKSTSKKGSQAEMEDRLETQSLHAEQIGTFTGRLLCSYFCAVLHISKFEDSSRF